MFVLKNESVQLFESHIEKYDKVMQLRHKIAVAGYKLFFYD